MKKRNVSYILQEMYDKAVQAVMEASGLPFEVLIDNRSEKSVTARVVLVDILLEQGMSEATISEVSGMSQQRVNALKNSARYKLRSLIARIIKEETLLQLTNKEQSLQGKDNENLRSFAPIPPLGETKTF